MSQKMKGITQYSAPFQTGSTACIISQKSNKSPAGKARFDAPSSSVFPHFRILGGCRTRLRLAGG